MTRRLTIGLWLLGCAVVAPVGVSAQGIDLRIPSQPDGRAPRQAPERDLGAPRLSVPDAPAFVGPLSQETATGRAGVAAWTSPSTPTGARGAGDPDNVGRLGFGLAVEWGGSPGGAAKRPRAN
jgi:hypothetical protein